MAGKGWTGRLIGVLRLDLIGVLRLFLDFDRVLILFLDLIGVLILLFCPILSVSPFPHLL